MNPASNVTSPCSKWTDCSCMIVRNACPCGESCMCGTISTEDVRSDTDKDSPKNTCPCGDNCECSSEGEGPNCGCKTKDKTNEKSTDSIETRKSEIPDCSCESAKK